MDIADIEKRIIDITVEQLGVKPEQVISEASFSDDLGADSLDAVELVMTFEEEFRLEISDEDAERIKKVKDAVDYLAKKLKDKWTLLKTWQALKPLLAYNKLG